MSKRSRFILILVVLGVCFAFLWPSISWYAFTPQEDQALALSSLERIRDYSLVMAGNDVEELLSMVRTDPASPVPEKNRFLEKSARVNYKGLNKTVPKTWTVSALLEAYAPTAELRRVMQGVPPQERDRILADLINDIETHYRNDILKAKSRYTNAAKLGLDLSGGISIIIRADLDAAIAAQQALTAEDGTEGSVLTSDQIPLFKDQAMAQAMETLTSRIDRFGLSEPVIRSQGEDRIYIEIPGAADTDRINTIIMGKGILNFRLVDDAATNAFRTHYASNYDSTFDANGLLLDPSVIPADTEVMGLYTKDEYGLDQRIDYLVVKREIALEGEHIKSAEIGTDNITGRPQVNFVLSPQGSEIFGAFTSAHSGESLAIVSDDKIKSYARINEPITGGRVAISGFGLDEAQNLQKVLQTAWLNVPLILESQQVIGASLGEQTIREGLMALVIGLLAVMVFMLVWYKGAGVNAIIAQILNLFMMFSILSAFSLTITLPSIAGMILTIGMAVDANVVIFERIKDELRLGKTRSAAITAGFSRAFWAVMDSNITTFIAAIFLSQLGTGSIKGFAVSLAIGVFSSVFTALFVSRLIFDFDTEVMKKQRVSIRWGNK
jgi:preprotein translocase subunit SecD